MPRPVMSRLARFPFALAVVLAFVGGVLFASALDWTRGAGAQGGLHLGDRLTGGAGGRELSGGFATIAERVTPAVVTIQTESRPQRPTLPPGHAPIPPAYKDYFRQFEQQDPEPERADGSGFLVSRDGLHPHQQPRRRRRGPRGGDAHRPPHLQGARGRRRSVDRCRGDQDRGAQPARRNARRRQHRAPSATGPSRSGTRSGSASP